MKVLKLLKVLFASYAAAIGIAIVMIVFGSMLLGFGDVDTVIEKYLIPVVLVNTLLLIPVMHKKLK